MKAAFAAALTLIAAPVALSATAAAAAQQDPAERARIEDLTRRLNGGPPAPQRAAPAAPAPTPAPAPEPRPVTAAAPQTTPPPAARQDAAERARIEELTRRLNGAPPVSAPAPRPTPTPAPQSAPQARPQSAPVRAAPVQPAPMRAAPQPQPSRAAEEAPVRRPPVAQSAPAPVPAPAPAPAGAPARPAPAPSPQGLSAAEVSALPFRIDLPPGFKLVEGHGAPGSQVYSARKAGKTYLMIYAGPSSQFPIYDGEQATAGGRLSVVTTDGARRVAMEHLFQRTGQPAEIHVWLMSLDGAERDQAESIAQSVDPK